MLSNLPIHQILFLDIETVPQYESFEKVPEEWKKLWEMKANILLKQQKENTTTEVIYDRAGIYAEFGKIICISCGLIQGEATQRKIILKSFYEEEEYVLLQNFCDMLIKFSINDQKLLCAHNGKEFDFPYICRRLLINGLPIPHLLNTAGKKPWEINHLDTMELWKFGDFKNYTSLNLLALSLGVPTPKDDIDGSMVSKVYYDEKNIRRIVAYCQKDVVTVAQVLLKIYGEALITPEHVEIKQ